MKHCREILFSSLPKWSGYFEISLTFRSLSFSKTCLPYYFIIMLLVLLFNQVSPCNYMNIPATVHTNTFVYIWIHIKCSFRGKDRSKSSYIGLGCNKLGKKRGDSSAGLSMWKQVSQCESRLCSLESWRLRLVTFQWF